MMTIKRGDTIPPLSITLTDNGAVVDLTTATTIKIIAVRAGAPVFTRTVTGTSLGVVNMPWQTTDTAVAGMMTLEVEVTWPQPFAVQTFPADSVLYVNVVPDLG
jgi:hypothetical protein